MGGHSVQCTTYRDPALPLLTGVEALGEWLVHLFHIDTSTYIKFLCHVIISSIICPEEPQEDCLDIWDEYPGGRQVPILAVLGKQGEVLGHAIHKYKELPHNRNGIISVRMKLGA